MAWLKHRSGASHILLRSFSRHGGRLMYFVAAVLVVLSGLFYAAGHHEIGSYSADVCRYGSTFCDSPAYVLAGAILAGIWGAFVSIR
jgi:hypothetical protein